MEILISSGDFFYYFGAILMTYSNVKLQLTFKKPTVKRVCLLIQVFILLTRDILRKIETFSGKI